MSTLYTNNFYANWWNLHTADTIVIQSITKMCEFRFEIDVYGYV